MIDDLGADLLAELLPDRAIRMYPAILSTEAEAMAWARAGAPEGAVVVAGYQASPRGRGGKPWQVDQGHSLAFSLILHPTWPIFREGWLYTVATSALSEVIGPDARIEWPDEVRVGRDLRAATGAHVEPKENQLWAVVSLLLCHAPPPRGEMLARVAKALETRYRADTEEVLADYLRRCQTIGRRVRARMVPLGPVGPVFEGLAVTSLNDGALVLETAEGRRIAVRPQHLGVLEDMAPVGGSTG